VCGSIGLELIKATQPSNPIYVSRRQGGRGCLGGGRGDRLSEKPRVRACDVGNLANLTSNLVQEIVNTSISEITFMTVFDLPESVNMYII
jgi:hypothetical protein